MVLLLAGLTGGVQLLAIREMCTVCKPGLKFYSKSTHMYVQSSARTGLLGRCNVMCWVSSINHCEKLYKKMCLFLFFRQLRWLSWDVQEVFSADNLSPVVDLYMYGRLLVHLLLFVFFHIADVDIQRKVLESTTATGHTSQKYTQAYIIYMHLILTGYHVCSTIVPIHVSVLTYCWCCSYIMQRVCC